jgi:hypothetical protein
MLSIIGCWQGWHQNWHVSPAVPHFVNLALLESYLVLFYFKLAAEPLLANLADVAACENKTKQK